MDVQTNQFCSRGPVESLQRTDVGALRPAPAAAVLSALCVLPHLCGGERR